MRPDPVLRAVETALTLRLLYHQRLRQAEGFLGPLLKWMDVDLPCPDHTTLSRRNRTVEVRRRIEHLPAGPIDFVVDSTGLKICGQGDTFSGFRKTFSSAPSFLSARRLKPVPENIRVIPQQRRKR
jgi:hypothetical protein